ncbi:MAG: hypothetical protein J7604_23950 [Sporocytophaga sp.]|uniref:hypothetical protein n=1 Tax=Sporocytophaga sp. TaxID=2231183 RepID=UPI001B171869|nr:hypothetical protein [Sporocytophaga sp.]MBO9703289.1 hypothetical protein [Sporocytophaga sp.]
MDKIIIYENWIDLFFLVINWGFVIGSILVGYIWGLIFFGLCAVMTTYPLIDPRKKVIFVGTKEYKAQIAKEFNDRLIDNGIFQYTENGFIISFPETIEVNWNQIQSIFGYKVDLMMTDLICIDVFCDNNISFSLTEETAGWFVFIDFLKEQFPTIEGHWNINISQTAFATNLTLVYDRENRSHEQAVLFFYNDRKKIIKMWQTLTNHTTHVYFYDDSITANYDLICTNLKLLHNPIYNLKSPSRVVIACP